MRVRRVVAVNFNVYYKVDTPLYYHECSHNVMRERLVVSHSNVTYIIT